MSMYKDRRVLCLILARGGSKGLPRKNILKIAEKPLIAHSIDVAKQVKYVDEIYVSTEDEEIGEIAKKFGANVIERPVNLATDDADYLEAMKHLISSIEDSKKNPVLVLLETTSPIRKVEDVKKCIEMYDSDVDCVVSVSNVKVHPSYMYVEKNGLLHSYLNLKPLKRRQLSEPLVAYNGSIVVTDCDFIKNQKDIVFGGRMKGYLLDDKYVDIDSKLDFDICKFLMESHNSEIQYD